ncbi:unnamed protein product [Cercospora beticola]|nr:unnamed protein product [Cercospora beticola]
MVECLDTDGLYLYAQDAEVHKVFDNDPSDGILAEHIARERAEETAWATCGCGRGQGLHSSPCDRSPNSLHYTTAHRLYFHRILHRNFGTCVRGEVIDISQKHIRRASSASVPFTRSGAKRHPTNVNMVLGRLTHYAFDAVLVSAFLAGVKRSTGLTYVSNPPSSSSPPEA